MRANYLASPPLVVAYALAGRMDVDLTTEPLGTDKTGKPVYLREIWPTPQEVESDGAASSYAESSISISTPRYTTATSTGKACRSRPAISTSGMRNPRTSNCRRILKICRRPRRLWRIFTERECWRCWATASPPTTSLRQVRSVRIHPAGRYLIANGVKAHEFNSYGARRGNHEVMARGTFANIRLKNQLAPGTEGGWTTVSTGAANK